MSEDLIKHGGLNEGLDFGQVERGHDLRGHEA